MVGAVAAAVAARDLPWQPQPQPHERNEPRPRWPLKRGEGRPYTLEASPELSSCTGKLGNFTFEDDGSCGHLSLNKTVRSIAWIPSFFSGYGFALPFDRTLRPKPAYSALQNALLEP